MKRSRPAANLPASLHKQLNMYALAASAAGVSLLALDAPAVAKIVYTPAHIEIPPNSQFFLDLNHDRVVVDFVFKNYLGTEDGRYRAYFGVNFSTDPGGNQVFGGTPGFCAAGLRKGKTIGPNKHFVTLNQYMASYLSTSLGKCPWSEQKPRYLGLKFFVNGQTHYGWARFQVHFGNGYPPGIHAVLSGYAYETIPNKPIIAGETKGPDEIGLQEPKAAVTLPARAPATLGLLAMGAPGLSIWRREESQGAAK